MEQDYEQSQPSAVGRGIRILVNLKAERLPRLGSLLRPTNTSQEPWKASDGLKAEREAATRRAAEANP